MGETAAEVARQVVEAAVSVIEATINEMLCMNGVFSLFTLSTMLLKDRI